MGGNASGALNSVGYSHSLNSNILPNATHITHNGVFNENYFEIGDKSTKLLDLHHGIAISNCDLYDLPTKNYFLSCFLKSSTDGQKRNRPLNVVVALDVSGSMDGTLTNTYEESVKLKMSRLDLARKAILMMFEKLQPQDVFGLVTFHNSAQTIISSNYVKNLNAQSVKAQVQSKFESGGTTIASGFYEALISMDNFSKDFTLGLNYQNRIVILTDVGDNSVQGERKLIEEISGNKNISTTIIGVSSDFRSQTCEKLVQVKGFNYLCAVEESDLQTYLVDQFDYTFFQCVQDVEISIQSEQINDIEVFGTVDNETRYPKKNNKFTVTKFNSGFPSALKINQNKQCETKGGLILVKMDLGKIQSLPHLKIKVTLTYSDMEGKKQTNMYLIDKNFQSEQFYSDQASKKGVSLFYYTQTVRNLLRDMSQEGQKNSVMPTKGTTLVKLENLKNTVLNQRKKNFRNSPKQSNLND